MDRNESVIMYIVLAIFFIVIWFIALAHAPFATGLFTFLAIFLGGTFLNSGDGDGRHGRG